MSFLRGVKRHRDDRSIRLQDTAHVWPDRGHHFHGLFHPLTNHSVGSSPPAWVSIKIVQWKGHAIRSQHRTDGPITLAHASAGSRPSVAAIPHRRWSSLSQHLHHSRRCLRDIYRCQSRVRHRPGIRNCTYMFGRRQCWCTAHLRRNLRSLSHIRQHQRTV